MNPLFEKLAAAEDQFFGSEFLSPVLRRVPVRVRIEGIVLTLKIHPANFEGWGVFRCDNQKTAKFVRQPSLREKQQYLSLLPRFSFVVCRQGTTHGIMATSDSRAKIVGQVPIALPEEVRLFDTVDTRWDGETFWYEGHSGFKSRRVAVALRDLFAVETDPKTVSVPEMSAEERLAYQIAFDFEIEAKRDRKEERLKRALQRGGATLRSYIERGTTYTVEYTVEGEHFATVVDSETLQINSAGICLSGGDRAFDLQSLVGVIKEGQNRHAINHVGIR